MNGSHIINFADNIAIIAIFEERYFYQLSRDKSMVSNEFIKSELFNELINSLVLECEGLDYNLQMNAIFWKNRFTEDKGELRLDLSNLRMKKLPYALKNFLYLKGLDITNNNFTEFPGIICYLTNLVELKIGNNEIQYLPSEIVNLSDLKTLCLTDNRFESITIEIFSLNLSLLDMNQD